LVRTLQLATIAEPGSPLQTEQRASVTILSMTATAEKQGKPYHHGHLREALIAASLELIGESGPRGFNLREVARRAGVSHNAPYRHFAAKDDLLLAVAEEGLAQLASTMERAMEPATNARERLQFSGCGYVDFAQRFPNHFAVMFDLPPDLVEQRKNEPIGLNAFGVLLRVIEQAQAEQVLPAGDPLPAALVAWSLVHGIAKLAVAGILPMGRERALEFTWKATGTMIEGLRAAK